MEDGKEKRQKGKGKKENQKQKQLEIQGPGAEKQEQQPEEQETPEQPTETTGAPGVKTKEQIDKELAEELAYRIKDAIARGNTPEAIAAIYLDRNAIRKEPRRVYRMDLKETRLYLTVDENGQYKYYVSVTSLCNMLVPKGIALDHWLMKNGFDAKEMKEERADYGTFMHSQIQIFLTRKFYDMEDLIPNMLQFMADNNVSEENFEKWLIDSKNDLASFAQFAFDYNIQPLAIEIMLASERAGAAGALDLPCRMYDKKYSEKTPLENRKMINAIVDFKSGRKGFYESHEMQLHIYKEIWEFNFPELPIDKLYNWAPTEWKGETPTYKLKDQTDSDFKDAIPHYLEIAKIRFGQLKKFRKDVSGVLRLGEEPKYIFNEPLEINICHG